MKHSTLFIDESGKSSLMEKKDEPFIMTGVILDEEEIKPIEGFFNYIKRKYNIDHTLPFHSYDIFENTKSKKTDIEAKNLLKAIADFISLIPIKICIISIDKKEFKEALGIRSDSDFKGNSRRRELKETPYSMMSAKLFSWFANYLDSENSIGEIIVDARRGGDLLLIRSLYICKDPNGPLNQNEISQIEKRCSAVCFAEKNFLSGGLEITDLISFTSFFHARRLMQQMNHISLNSVWKEVKLKLDSNQLKKINKKEVKSFYKIKKGEVHKYLK